MVLLLALLLLITNRYYVHSYKNELARRELAKQQQLKQTKQKATFSFLTERLESLKENSVVVVGSSLVRCGLPFDHDLNTLAMQWGMDIDFVRFTKPGNDPLAFQPLLDCILTKSPRWVFLQAEPFFLSYACTDIKQSSKPIDTISNDQVLGRFIHKTHHTVQIMLNIIEHNLSLLISGNKTFATSDATKPGDPDTTSLKRQNDSEITPLLEKQADPEAILNEQCTFKTSPPIFPEYVETFLARAKTRDIKVILLEMNRSREGNMVLGTEGRQQLTATLEQVSERYKIPFWKFQDSLPAQYYGDRAHLNNAGRKVFTKWFLENLRQEYNNE
ncbi:hypothetical protein [Desulfopila sp. IMCC35008]|uniref:hypothetical protein n=1 Tax=Desulfopila sp. IMCC35008 TaxID=2653858 RepID=UPI002714AC85|nr:hypothetical protein [Desulfopila sp. IMCC35008]